MSDEFDDHDTGYWERYYGAHPDPGDPSGFARHVAATHLGAGATLLELGCGNGRDAVFLAQRCAGVVAVDRCEPEVAYLAERFGSPGLRFECADFTRLADDPRVVQPAASGGRHFDVVYARFTLHSVAAAGQQRVVASLDELVAPDGGLVAFEFRGLHNELLGVGEPVGDDGDVFVHQGHARRFIDADALAAELEARGYTVVEFAERPGFAPYGDDDETYARIIARRGPASG